MESPPRVDLSDRVFRAAQRTLRGGQCAPSEDGGRPEVFVVEVGNPQ